MKKFFLISVIIITSASLIKAQTPYTSSKDSAHPEVKILNGVISKYILQNDASFGWYASNQNAYKPDAAVLNAMEAAKNKFQFVVFGGTWCEDTQFILPKFFKLQEQAGVADNNISFFAVNREKQTLGNVASAFKIINVPTIIVMKDGKEVGRVVEYGKTGKWDKELTDILQLF
ncbi:MAG: thioredoxin family protein [Ferruginibacter sp.]